METATPAVTTPTTAPNTTSTTPNTTPTTAPNNTSTTPNTTPTTTPTTAPNNTSTTPNTIPTTAPNTTSTTPNTTPTTVPNTIPTTPNTIPTDPMIIEDDAPIQLKSPKKEGNEKPPASKKKPTRTSDVWDHYTKLKGGDPNNPRCTCNYCGSDYACHSQKCGTKSLWVHLDKCKKNPQRIVDKKQKVLSFHKTNLLAATFNTVRSRNALAKFVVKDEQAFRVVEGAGFKEFINELQPMFNIPSRITVARDICHLFSNERAKLKEEMTTAGQRVCLTTDCWTARTQISYMCITAHYIDANWNLQKRIINFCQISNHKGDTIGKLIESCLLEWGIERVFTVTMDNASANDVAVGFLRRRVNAWKGSVLGGDYLHVRCGAHIINLIVSDGLHKLHDSIAAIRNSVRYIRSSPARLLKFRACVEKERIDYKGGLILDVATRWNSTYMMLDVALKFEKAFTRYEEEDDKYLSYFMEKENGKTKIGPPTSTDWESAAVFVKFLATFYEVTLKFSGTLHVTSNNFYHEICEIQSQVADLADANDPLLSNMAASMREKYDKYWGNVDNINPLLFLAVVLDPRYKMKYLKYCFESVYDSATVARLLVKVESILQSLYTCYDFGSNGVGHVGSKNVSNNPAPKNVAGRSRLLENYMQRQQMETIGNKTDLDYYLAEEPLNPLTTSFDILLWWKDNSIRYKTLSLIAKDVLAIPVSTVASESAFSTSGRILDPFRSSLSPRMLEVLVCTQSWLKERHDEKKSKEYVDDIHSYGFLDEGDNDKGIGASKEKLKGKAINIIDD